MLSLKELDAVHHYQTDKLGGCAINRHDYSDAFEFHLSKFRDQRIVMWEIGVDRGGSLAMWADYFPKGMIVGIDVKEPPVGIEYRDNATWCLADATDPASLSRLLSISGPPDIVLDDGSHVSEDMYKSFNLFYPVTRQLYIVEDLGTQYEEKHGRQYLRDIQFMPLVQTLCNRLAKYECMSAARVCYEPGQVYIYPNQK